MTREPYALRGAASGEEKFRGFRPHAVLPYQEDREETDGLEEFAEELRGHILAVAREGRLMLDDEAEVYHTAMEWLQERLPDWTYSQCSSLARAILQDMKGYGPIHQLMTDPEVSDIIIHTWNDITYEKLGEKYRFEGSFRGEQHLRLFVEKLAHMGRARIDEATPLATFTLPEGHRVAAAVPPIARDGSTVAIRKFVKVPTPDELVADGFFSPEACEFFRLAVVGRRNIIFTGGMGTGKTTMIAVAGHFMGDDDHVMLIEEVAECPIRCSHLRRLVARPPSIEGTGEVKLAHLLKVALMMKPTRILVSEVRDGAVFYMLQAMLVGHEGSMSTLHADSPEDAFYKRMPMMLSMAEETVRFSQEEKISLISSAVHLLFHLVQDARTGRRYCARIAEVTADPPGVRDLFVRKDGVLVPTGVYPDRAAEGAVRYGVEFPRELFFPAA